MDDKSRLLIDEMLAEEQFYFGGTDSLRRPGLNGGLASAGGSPEKPAPPTMPGPESSGYVMSGGVLLKAITIKRADEAAVLGSYDWDQYQGRQCRGQPGTPAAGETAAADR